MSNFDLEFDLDFDEIERQQRRIEEIERMVAAMEVTGRSRGGEVTAVMKGTGQFTGISFDPGLLDGSAGRQHSLETIGVLVLEAVNDGLSKLDDATRKRFEPLVATEPVASADPLVASELLAFAEPVASADPLVATEPGVG